MIKLLIWVYLVKSFRFSKMNFNRNYYKILGIEPTDDENKIKQAYKALVKRWHPDLNDNSPESRQMMKDINEAYEVLSDYRLRNEYNKLMFGSIKGKKNNIPNYSYTSSYKPVSEEVREQVRKKYENKYTDASKYYSDFEKNIEEGRKNVCTGSFSDKLHIINSDAMYFPSGIRFFMQPVFWVVVLVWHSVDVIAGVLGEFVNLFVTQK